MKILIADKIAPGAIEIFESEDGINFEEKLGLSEDELVEVIIPFTALVVRSSVQVTPKIIEAASNLKVIGRPGVGVDNIDLDAATKKGVAVMNTPFGNTNAAAEHTIAMIFSLSRHIHHAHHSLKHKKEWDRKSFIGCEVKGKTLGLVGLGNVGKVVAQLASGLQMKVLAYDPFVKAKDIKALGAEKVEFEDILEKSDYITVHVPLIDETRNMIDKEEFAKMKDGAKIINVARGGIINEDALYDALKSGKVSGAAIDVWEQEPAIDNKLLELDTVLGTPHLGASTVEAQDQVALDVARQIIDALKHGKFVNVVNKEVLEKFDQ